MRVNFEELPGHSRLWIYQSNRPFQEKEIPELKTLIEQFLEQWTAHGQDLRAAYDLPYNRFVVLGLDQSQASASGCSIDSSVHFIQHLEKTFGVELLDKMNVTYKQGEFVAHKSLSDFKQMAKQRAVGPNTVVFNNLVATKDEYLENWEVPARESWHARFF